MTWQHWIVFVLFIVAAALQPRRVGQPTKPFTGSQATLVAITQLIFAGLVWWGAS